MSNENIFKKNWANDYFETKVLRPAKDRRISSMKKIPAFKGYERNKAKHSDYGQALLRYVRRLLQKRRSLRHIRHPRRKDKGL